MRGGLEAGRAKPRTHLPPPSFATNALRSPQGEAKTGATDSSGTRPEMTFYPTPLPALSSHLRIDHVAQRHHHGDCNYDNRKKSLVHRITRVHGFSPSFLLRKQSCSLRSIRQRIRSLSCFYGGARAAFIQRSAIPSPNPRGYGRMCRIETAGVVEGRTGDTRGDGMLRCLALASGLMLGGVAFTTNAGAAPMAPAGQSLAGETVVHGVQSDYCLRRHRQCGARFGYRLRYRRCMRRYGC